MNTDIKVPKVKRMLLGRTPLGHKTLRDGTIITRIIEEDEPAIVIDNGWDTVIRLHYKLKSKRNKAYNTKALVWIEFLKSLLWLDEIPAVWFPKEKDFIKYGDVVFAMLKSGEFFYSRSIAHRLSPLDLKWKLHNQRKTLSMN
ncbi:hypothetical protein [Metamycoplasma hominis]|uniref:hypothetical protein n=2 Tax=Metamycoplasma hominis TaxID=2098 RepID=UPI002913C591|nr:hypothetical protein [Metamycoplasma hominis]